MKILMINAVCGTTSTGRICADIADLLSEAGHECKIAYARGNVPEKWQKYAVKIGSDADVKLHALSTRIFDNTGFCSKSATRKFLKWVEAFQPDVIHLHNLHGYYIHIGLLFEFLKKYNKPVVWTLHDCWSFTGHCAYYSFEKCDRWQTGCYSCPLKREYPGSSGFDRSKKNYEQKKQLFCGVKNLTIVTPSEWLKGEIEKSYLKDYPVQVIHNGIDTELFRPFKSNFKEKHGIADKKIVLGVANVWAKRKGIADFIRLSERLPEAYKIVLVGDLYGEKIPDSILHIQHTDSQKELAEIYSVADVFVNPTYEDNFPTTNLEALSCGTAVLTYQTGGSPESLCDTCGRAVAQGDTEGLLQEILKGASFSEACRAQAEKYDKKKRFSEYIELYEKVSK
ncbi:MAG: glycosyltransferase [Clostridia bacterium]|nr:glycosyltransferase [Clostridia bacterium]